MFEALHNFSKFNGTKTVIIGDMLELGAESEKEHHAILDLANQLNFEEIITVGQHFKKSNLTSKAFEKSAELSEYLKTNKISSDNILLKASRGIALEKILEFI